LAWFLGRVEFCLAQQDDELVVEDVTQYAGFRQLLKRLEAVVA